MTSVSTLSVARISRSLFKEFGQCTLNNYSLWDKNIVNKNYWEWLLLQENKMQLTLKMMSPYLLKNIAKDILPR